MPEPRTPTRGDLESRWKLFYKSGSGVGLSTRQCFVTASDRERRYEGRTRRTSHSSLRQARGRILQAGREVMIFCPLLLSPFSSACGRRIRSSGRRNGRGRRNRGTSGRRTRATKSRGHRSGGPRASGSRNLLRRHRHRSKTKGVRPPRGTEQTREKRRQRASTSCGK